MLYALTAEQMRDAEEAAVHSGVATLSGLMRRAGAAVAAEAAAGAPEGRIVIISGKGNNGGDGWVAARELHSAGRDVLVATLADPSELGGPAREAADEALAAGVPAMRPVDDASLLAALGDAALVVDAMFGFGFRGPARDPYARAIEAVNDADAAVLAVDIPSGVETDTGVVNGDAVRADVTLTFSAPKPGLVLFPGADHAGEIRVADVGIPRELVDSRGLVELWDEDDYLDVFPFASPDSHKGSRGRVLVVAGSTGMTGSAALASTAALRMGAGYVRLACAASLLDVLAVKLTAVVLVPLPESAPGILAEDAAAEVLRLADGYDAVVLGPGLTTQPSASRACRGIVERLDIPLVIDADALNAVAAAGEASVLFGRDAPTIVTPHPGEAARLLRIGAADVQADRLGAATRLAADAVACVLKGAGTVVAGEGRLLINASGNAGMATAGTGDVLSGMLGTLLAQGLSPFEAAALGVYLHGWAGDIAALALSETCVTAEDLPAALPEAVRGLLGCQPTREER